MANPILPGRKTPTLGPGQVLRDSWTYTAAGFKIPLKLPLPGLPPQFWYSPTFRRLFNKLGR